MNKYYTTSICFAMIKAKNGIPFGGYIGVYGQSMRQVETINLTWIRVVGNINEVNKPT